MLLRLSYWLLQVAFAQDQDPCIGVPDEFCEPRNAIAEGFQDFVGGFVGFSGGLAVLFTVWGGIIWLKALGDDGEITKGRFTIIWALVGFGVTLGAQTLAMFVGQRAQGVVDAVEVDELVLNLAFLQGVTSIMLYLFNAIFIMMAIWAGFRMIIARGNADEFSKAKNMLYWGIGAGLVTNVAHAAARAIFLLGI